MIYLDNAATSLIKPKFVKSAVINAMEKLCANPGRSGHKLSQDVAQVVFDTREKIKEFFNAKTHNVIFTKNCSEALNLSILGNLKNGDHVITTCYEHNSVLRTLEHLKSKGVEVTILDCDLADFSSEFESRIKANTKMIITNGVSNVTGEICNVKQVGKICKKHNLIYLVDGAQMCGHLKINVDEFGIDMLAFAGHKGMLGITGVGGLVVSQNINLNPIMFGGTGTESESLIQPATIPEGFEVGTLPTIPIVSLSAGLDFLNKNFKNLLKNEEKLSKYAYFQLKKLNFIEIYSKPTSCNVFSFNIKNQDSMAVANELNCFGICVRAGFHCAPLIHKKLGTIVQGAIRVSLDFNNTEKDIDYLIFALKKINEKLSS